MNDYLSIATTDFNYEKLKSNPELNFYSKVDTSTGELITNEYGNSNEEVSFCGLCGTIFHNTNGVKCLSVKGSIHKMYNFGKHNFNDYEFAHIKNSIKVLECIFCFDSKDVIIHNLEIGVNIIPPVSNKKILRGLLIHRSCIFEKGAISKSNYYQARHTNYIIKAYDKSKHYRSHGYFFDHEIFRFELKYMRMSDLIRKLNKEGVITRDYILLSDLQNIEVQRCFGKILLQKWKEIIFYDFTISKKKLNPHIANKLDFWQNRNNWDEFNKQQTFDQKKQLQNVVNSHSKKIQHQVATLIEEKINELIQDKDHIESCKGSNKHNQLTNLNKFKTQPINTLSKERNGFLEEKFFTTEEIENGAWQNHYGK